LNQTTTRLMRAAALASVVVAIPALAVAADDGPMTTVRTFLDDFNKGDVAGAQATNADDESIIDEVPPHEWHGPGAFQAWLTDLGKASSAAGQTDEKVTLNHVVRDQIDGDTAYVVVKVTFNYLQHGKPVVEPAEIAAALANRGGVWTITGWAWAGETPQPGQP
jgi:SnoaL-like protein